MKKYLAFMKLRWNVELQYRFAAVAGIFTQIFFGFMYIFIYEAYYRTGISSGMEWNHLLSYLWLQQAFYFLIFFNIMDSDIYDSIITGQVSYEFVRPFNIYWLWFTKLVSRKYAGTILRSIPVILIASLLPQMYSIHAPASAIAFILFAITLFLGSLLIIGIGMLIYTIMFYTISAKGIFSIYSVIAQFFAGMIIPIPFMPETLQKICYILPFRLTVDLPFRLYSGNISVEEGIQSVALQIIWLAGIVSFGLYLMKRAGKRLVVQGG